MEKMKAVFLDRDGTIIVDKNYMHKIADIEYYPDTFTALKLIQSRGYEIFVVTNQSGVGRGMFAIEDVFLIHDAIQAELVKRGIKPFLDIRVCPDTPDKEGTFRKPAPDMILELAEKWDIDLDNSWMLGDKDIDALCGLNAGVSAATVRKEWDDYYYFENLTEFSKALT
jgi:D-glycero-D-manno-heptose 1,7-bisphosphate phosphatase